MDGEILVIGSQAILGSYEAEQLPPEATMSVEADLAFWDDPDDAKADLVDGVIGELSAFQEAYGYYAQGVSVSTAHLPAGWRDRVVAYDRPEAAPSSAVCLEAHDLVVSKLVAGREKDLPFAAALLAADLVDVDTLIERAGTIDSPEAVRNAIRARIRRCAGAARPE